MCTPPDRCDLPSPGEKELGMGAEQVGVRGTVLGLQPWRWSRVPWVAGAQQIGPGLPSPP